MKPINKSNKLDGVTEGQIRKADCVITLMGKTTGRYLQVGCGRRS